MTTYLLDTNIFVRFLVPENRRMFEECTQLFHLVQERKLVVRAASYVYAELVWVLESFYTFTRHDINKALRTFLLYGITPDERVNLASAIDVYATKNNKFVDALLAAHPAFFDGSNTALVSYDRDFDKLGITRVEPREVVTLCKKVVEK